MSKYIIYNEELLPFSEAMLSLENRSFRYADGLFETIRLQNEKPCLLHYHIDRLTSGMHVLGIENHDSFSEENLTKWIGILCEKNEIQADARCRLHVFRAGGGLYAPETNKAAFLMELSPIDAKQYESTKKLSIFRDYKKTISPLSNLKSVAAQISVLAAIHARQNQCDDAVILNTSDNVCEAVSSNIFLYKEEKIVTPCLTEGCVGGVMRKHLLTQFRQAGYQVEERVVDVNEFETADLVFLSNAIAGIQLVVQIDTVYTCKLPLKLFMSLKSYCFM